MDEQFVHAWGGGGYPKTGPVPGYNDLDYSRFRLYQHACGHIEEWSPQLTDFDEDAGCDACESAPWSGSWQPLYREADSYKVAEGIEAGGTDG